MNGQNKNPTDVPSHHAAIDRIVDGFRKYLPEGRDPESDLMGAAQYLAGTLLTGEHPSIDRMLAHLRYPCETARERSYAQNLFNAAPRYIPQALDCYAQARTVYVMKREVHKG